MSSSLPDTENCLKVPSLNPATMKSPSGDTARALPFTESLKSPVALSLGVSLFFESNVVLETQSSLDLERDQMRTVPSSLHVQN